MKHSIVFAIVAFALTSIAVGMPASVDAIDKCKVKVDKKTGIIRADATGVSGTLQWGETSGQENNAFFNAGTCVTGGKAKKCELADPATLASKTPPEGCTLYLDDGAAPCSVWISGCAPGVRDGSGVVADISALQGDISALQGDVGTLEDEAIVPRVIHTPDTRVGCPPIAATDDDLISQTFFLAEEARVQTSANMVGLFNGPHFLSLHIDGVEKSITVNDTAIDDWQENVPMWSGVLAAGAHTISVRSLGLPNVWGCDNRPYGAIDTIIFETATPAPRCDQGSDDQACLELQINQDCIDCCLGAGTCPQCSVAIANSCTDPASLISCNAEVNGSGCAQDCGCF